MYCFGGILTFYFLLLSSFIILIISKISFIFYSLSFRNLEVKSESDRPKALFYYVQNHNFSVIFLKNSTEMNIFVLN